MARLLQIAKQINAKIYNPYNLNTEVDIVGIAPLNRACKEDLSFYFEPRFRKELENSQAAAVIVKESDAKLRAIQLVHTNPREGLALAGQLFYRYRHSFSGVSARAEIHEDAHVAQDADIYPFAFVDSGAQIASECKVYPFAFIGADVSLGARTIVFPGAVVLESSVIGADSIIHANAVVGSDGFGFSLGKSVHKIPQMGRVVIEDKVEIGSLSNVDRATFDTTRIGRSSKIDSQVQIGHNVQVGQDCIVCGQVGIAGSARLGDRVIAAGQVGISQGVYVNDDVVLGAKCGVVKDITEPGTHHGHPNREASAWRRESLSISKLPELLKRVQSLEKELSVLAKATNYESRV